MVLSSGLQEALICLSSLEFFFWGVIKDRVYGQKFTEIESLQAAIVGEVSIVNGDTDLLHRVCASVTNRIQECSEVNGGHFEKNR